jgi:hypothetical protein
MDLAEFIFCTFQLILGLIMCSAGGLLAWHVWQRFRHTPRFAGEVIGAHAGRDERGAQFRLLFSYIDASGEKRKVLGDSSVRSIDKVKLGAPVTLLIDPNDPLKNATTGTLKIFAAIGIAVLCAGLSLDYFAFVRLADSKIMLLSAAACAALIAAMLLPRLHRLRKEMRSDQVLQWRDSKRQRLAEDLEDAEVLNVNQVEKLIAEASQDQTRLKETAARLVMPLSIIIGLAILGFGGPWSYGQLKFLTRAASYEGVVIRNDYTTTRSNNTYTSGYHAVIEYRIADKATTVTDWLGMQSTQFDVGERVRLLVDSSNQNKAIVDRGFWNWLLPVGVLGIGILLIFGSLRAYLKVVRAKRIQR